MFSRLWYILIIFSDFIRQKFLTGNSEDNVPVNIKFVLFSSENSCLLRFLATAVSACEVLKLPTESLRDFLLKHEDVAVAIAEEINQPMPIPMVR